MRFWVDMAKGSYQKDIIPGQSVSAWDGVRATGEYIYNSDTMQIKITVTRRKMGAPYEFHRIRVEVTEHKFKKPSMCVVKVFKITKPKIPVEPKMAIGDSFPIFRYSGQGFGTIVPEYSYFWDGKTRKEQCGYFVMMVADEKTEIEKDAKVLEDILGSMEELPNI